MDLGDHVRIARTLKDRKARKDTSSVVHIYGEVIEFLDKGQVRIRTFGHRKAHNRSEKGDQVMVISKASPEKAQAIFKALLDEKGIELFKEEVT